MKAQVITKTLNQLQSNNENFSLGFKRYFVLPQRVKMNVLKSFYAKTGSIDNHNAIVDHFGSMTESEYTNFLKLS